MGLLDRALKGHHKRLRESERGRTLAKAFQGSGFNDGTPEQQRIAADLYKDFYLTIKAAAYVPEDVALEFASNTVNSRWPILFDVALNYALNQFTRDQLLDFYHSEKEVVQNSSDYVNALFPEFLSSRPRTAGNLNDVRIFQTQMSLLIIAVADYIGME